MKAIAYRIETPRLVLRHPSPDYAEAQKHAEDESRAHLSTFMLWAAKGTQSIDAVATKLRAFRAAFDNDEDFIYTTFDRKSGAIVGGCGLHPRVAGEGGVAIGYWVHPKWTRAGLATEMAASLTRVAFEVGGVRFVEIRCARTNDASAGVPPKLGFVHEATLRQRIELPGGRYEDALVFSLLAEDYAKSSTKAVETVAYDAAGQKLL
jgi:RimJ/RimL family protein N-acetyltransferase